MLTHFQPDTDSERAPLGPLRIAMIAACPFPYPRGTPVRIYRMAEALQARGHRVHVITYHLGRRVPQTTFRIHRIPRLISYRHFAPGPTLKKLALLDPLLAWRVRQLLRRYQFDVVHAHHYEGLLVAKAQRASPPVVYDAHTILAAELPFYSLRVGSRAKRAVGQFLDRHLPPRADHVIAVTDAVRDRLIDIEAVSPDQVTVVSSGVETDVFDAAEPLRVSEQRTIIFSGNLAAYQGVDLLLAAFRRVLNHRFDVRLLILTESSFEAYEAQADALGIRQHIDVIRTTFSEVPQYLLGADVAVSPRTSGDGIPQKLLNYMAAARPIVCFDGSAGPLRHLEDGWLVRNDDTESFASAILSLLDRPGLAARLGRAARRRVDEEFSWERAAERTEEVYAAVLGREVRHEAMLV